MVRWCTNRDRLPIPMVGLGTLRLLSRLKTMEQSQHLQQLSWNHQRWSLHRDVRRAHRRHSAQKYRSCQVRFPYLQLRRCHVQPSSSRVQIARRQVLRRSQSLGSEDVGEKVTSPYPCNSCFRFHTPRRLALQIVGQLR